MTESLTGNALDADVIVIGGGLAGLTAAACLADAGQRVKLLEASGRLGGRIQSLSDPVAGGYLGDLGPTWVWPGTQPLAAEWLDRLGLEMVPQYETGEAIVEQDHQSAPIRYRLPGMYDSFRIVGGTKAIIDRLAEKLPSNAVELSAQVSSVATAEGAVTVHVDGSDRRSWLARHLIVATPLRIAATQINWSPALPEGLVRAMTATPTWMAAQAKAVVVYDRPFWRDQGLSGRLASRVGPLVEAHDHSGPDGTPAVLFGFIGWPHEMRERLGEDLRDQVVAQLVRCFGRDAGDPRQCHVEDWASNAQICAPLDLSEPPEYPRGVPAIVHQATGSGRVHFAVAETATRSPGLIEGAFAAGEAVAARLAAQRLDS